ncbi:cysteine desulfurase [Candidatus Saccharibacteria bacterium]|nr:cysteine desulfurase [Candidatus Saccharibacteria bacterium]
MVYLDYSATSPLLPEVKTAMLSAMEMTGNASSLHTPGHLTMNIIEDAREEIAKLIGAKPEEILFTSGGTESNNTVTNIFAGKNVAVSAIEHPSLLESAKLRCNTTIIPVDKDGRVSGRAFPAYDVPDFDGETKKDINKAHLSLVSVMLANNEIGTINDIKALAKEAHAHGALFHTDATQALGKIKINVKDLDVDYMTISSHKIGGPIGIGALYIKKGSPFTPLIIGGHQEHGRRAGTYQTVNIAGFGAAAKYANNHQTWEIYNDKIKPLRDELRKRILAEIPYSSSNTPKNHSLPHLLNCSFEAAEGESIQLYLDAEGDIIVSTGSACASGDGKPSHVIMATKNDAEIAHSSVRFSLGLDTTENDINHVMKYLPGIVKRLQGISTLTAGKIKKEDSYYA